MAQNRQAVAKRMSEILADTRKEYKAIQERDRMEQARNGAENIITHRFAYKENEADAQSLVTSAGASALKVIDEAIEAAGGSLVEAPSAEAANYITSIAQRDDLTSDEVDAALMRYADHASQKAIKSAASRSGLRQYAGMTDAETYMADLRGLRADVAKTYTPEGFSTISDGYAAILDGGYRSFATTPGADAVDAIAASGSPVW